jgi:hypothetical protein
MPWHPVASGMCDRNVNAADGVGSWKHEPRTHPAHADGRLLYNGADRDAKMEIPDKEDGGRPMGPARIGENVVLRRLATASRRVASPQDTDATRQAPHATWPWARSYALGR